MKRGLTKGRREGGRGVQRVKREKGGSKREGGVKCIQQGGERGLNREGEGGGLQTGSWGGRSKKQGGGRESSKRERRQRRGEGCRKKGVGVVFSDFFLKGFSKKGFVKKGRKKLKKCVERVFC